MSSVLVVQCFLFADGGVLTLGANIFNMALIGVGVGYILYRAIIRILGEQRGGIAAVAIASWGSVVAASLCCAGELAWSGTVSWTAAFPAMAGIHSLIGLGEALITTLVITAVKNTRPELLAQNSKASPAGNTGTFIIYGIVISIGLVLFVSPFASEWPDGLEAAAAKLGFDNRAVQHPVVPGMIPDYRFPGIDSPAAATIAAGAAGIAILLAVMLLLTRHLKGKA
jgi:cobalt/nickel transport system permease protein